MAKLRNQPKYNFFKNTGYALAGLKDALLNESSFKIEIIIIAILEIILLFVEVKLTYKMILAISLFIPLIAELINSAIERVVDLVTLKQHILAKQAKDLGSSVVFLSISMTVCIWLCIFYLIFQGN